MWPWKQKEPDAVDRICRCLKDRWWEWTPTSARFPDGEVTVGVQHLTGVRLCFSVHHLSGHGYYQRAAMAEKGESWTINDFPDSNRYWKAYQEYLANKVSSRTADLGATAKAMAQAVMDGRVEAAYGLADWIIEHCGGDHGN